MAAIPGTRSGLGRGNTPPASPDAAPERAGRQQRDSAAARRRARAAHEAAAEALPRRRAQLRRRVSGLMITSLALLAVAIVGLVQVLQTSQIAATGYDVRALEVERQSLDAQIRLLEAEIASSTNLDHLHAQAVDRLGMQPPEDHLRVGVDVTAPGSVPLPRRYVPEQQHEPLPEPAWWESLIGRLPGLP